MNDEDGTAHVWTAQRPIITKLKRNPSAVLLDEGKHEGSACAEFELPDGLVSLRSKKKSAPKLSDEQKAVLAERLRNGRASSHTPPLRSKTPTASGETRDPSAEMADPPSFAGKAGDS